MNQELEKACEMEVLPNHTEVLSRGGSVWEEKLRFPYLVFPSLTDFSLFNMSYQP